LAETSHRTTDINADKLAEFFVEKIGRVRAAACRRRMFTMVHLDNLCQVSIEEVRHWCDDAFACHRLKIGDSWSYAPPVKNFWLRRCKKA